MSGTSARARRLPTPGADGAQLNKQAAVHWAKHHSWGLMESEQLRELLSVAAPLGFGGPRAVECERFGMIRMALRFEFATALLLLPLFPQPPPPKKNSLISALAPAPLLLAPL